MIKIEHSILYNRRIAAFAVEASKDTDLAALDLLYKALDCKPGLKLNGYDHSRRFVFHVTDMPDEVFQDSEGNFIKDN